MKPNRKLRLNSRIKPRVYVRGNTMYEKSSILLTGTGVRKNSTVASGSSPIKIHYFEYPKRFLNRINVHNFSIKYCYSDNLLKDILLKKHKLHL